MANMILTKAENHLKGRCNDNKQKEIFVKNFACVQSRTKSQPVDICTEKGTIMLEKLKDIPKDKRIQGICCTMYFIKECCANAFSSLCGPETVDYFEGILEEVVSIQLFIKLFQICSNLI